MLEVFIKKLRLVVIDDDSSTGKIFLKKDGVFFYKGIIGRSFFVFVVKSGIRLDILISYIDFRKWIMIEM